MPVSVSQCLLVGWLDCLFCHSCYFHCSCCCSCSCSYCYIVISIVSHHPLPWLFPFYMQLNEEEAKTEKHTVILTQKSNKTCHVNCWRFSEHIHQSTQTPMHLHSSISTYKHHKYTKKNTIVMCVWCSFKYIQTHACSLKVVGVYTCISNLKYMHWTALCNSW